MKTLCTIVAAAVFAVAVGASNDARADGHEVTIGFAIALSGWMELYDRHPYNGAQIAIEKINAEGGILGKQIRVVSADTKSDRAEGTKAGKKVLRDGAQFMVVSCDYDMGGPAALTAQAAGVVAMATCASDPKMGVQGIGRYVFSMALASQGEGFILADYGHKELSLRKPYVLLDDSIEYNKGVCQGFMERWVQITGGEKIVGYDIFKQDDASIASQITRIKNNSPAPDNLMICSYGTGLTSALRQIRAAGIDLPILHGEPLDGSWWLDAVPDISDLWHTAYGSIHDDDPNRDHQWLLEEYRKCCGEPESSFYIPGYATIEAYKRAVEIAGSFDSDKVLAAFETFDEVPLMIGASSFTADQHIQNKRPMLIMEVQNGKKIMRGYYGTAGEWKVESLFSEGDFCSKCNCCIE